MSEVPTDFIEIIDCLPPAIDRKLGYFGDGRYVTFHYEPRAQDVIWQDDRTFGIATGAWSAFTDEIQPLADAYGVNVGADGRPADHVLVCDRVRMTAYFAPRQAAEAFLTRRRDLLPQRAVVQ
ncbi:MAG TPA: hypothetical protein VN541_07910 [Tepidisphaeraceae bacterium]|nr:hypothetical protein [Tepidisphaeraceae bacterium]